MVKKITSSKLFTLIVIWVALMIIFTVAPLAMGKTPIITKIVDIIDLMIVTSFLAVGAGFLMVSGNMDLSAAGIGAFGCVCTAVLIQYSHLPAPIAMIIALVACVIFGVLNGTLVNQFKCPAFIATMAMNYVAKGCMQWVSVDPETGNAGSVYVYNDFVTFIRETKIVGLPLTFYIALIVFIIYGIILSKSVFGMKMYLVGGNPTAAHLVGINPYKYILILFANSGFLAGIAGILYMCRANQGDLNALSLNQFTGMTAAILGGVSFGGGNGNIAGVFIGLMILNTFNKGMLLCGASTYWTTVLSGVLLLVALVVDNIQTARKRKIV
ncbi:MAG: ABC transporter permease [Oscillospiraceae bacterium]|nr:ABC transporter permease [Oscillospiraceae bacterium]